MDNKLNLVLYIFLINLIYSVSVFSQNSNTQQSQDNAGTVIELETKDIKVVVEKPQVTLFSDRIKPNFDQVKMQKSFIPEIVGAGENFVIRDKSTDRSAYVIDIKKIVNKQR